MRPSEREREAPIEVFSCEICKMLRPSIFTEHFRATSSAFWKSNLRLYKKVLREKMPLDTAIYIYIHSF